MAKTKHDFFAISKATTRKKKNKTFLGTTAVPLVPERLGDLEWEPEGIHA